MSETKKLTFDEWKKEYGSVLLDDPFESADEKRNSFYNSHGLMLDDEIEMMNKEEYELYKQRYNAEQELQVK